MEKSNMVLKNCYLFLYFFIGVLKGREILVFMNYKSVMKLWPCTFNSHVYIIFHIFFIKSSYFSYSNISTRILDKILTFNCLFITVIDFNNACD